MSDTLATLGAARSVRARRTWRVLGEAFWVWLRVAASELRRPRRPDRGHAPHPGRGEALDFGESRFLHALNYCMLLPGPEAQQLATYIGWLMHRTRGGIMAGGLFVLPGVVAIMALS